MCIKTSKQIIVLFQALCKISQIFVAIREYFKAIPVLDDCNKPYLMYLLEAIH